MPQWGLELDFWQELDWGFWLDTHIDVCMARCEQRNRDGEARVDMEYQTALRRKHFELFVHDPSHLLSMSTHNYAKGHPFDSHVYPNHGKEWYHDMRGNVPCVMIDQQNPSMHETAQCAAEVIDTEIKHFLEFDRFTNTARDDTAPNTTPIPKAL